MTIIGLSAIELAFSEISKFERIHQFKAETGICWNWEKDIHVNGSSMRLFLRIEFTPQFPLVWPKICIEEETFKRIGWIPHVDSNRYLCLFDNYTTPDYFTSPNIVVFEAMQKAKRTIISGLNQVEDYYEEYLSYWKLSYDNVDDGAWKILLWGDIALRKNSSVKVYNLKEHIGGCFCAIVNAACKKHFEEYLLLTGNKIDSISEAFFVGSISSFDKPPFLLKNKDIYETLTQNKIAISSNFQNYFSKVSRPIVLFKKELGSNGSLALGWFHQSVLKKEVNGFRKGITQRLLQLCHLQKDDYVRRLSFEDLSLKRLYHRTSGMEYEDSPCFLLLGVGSIGSNLFHFLNSYNPYWTFIDNDILRIENIGRHYLGLEYTGEYKVDAIKKFLIKKNPHIGVNCYNRDILDVFGENPSEFCSNDFIFSCLGEFNVESYLGEHLFNGTISSPVFFIWVEPYLAGGHCLYIPPETKKFSNFFSDGFYVNNVIESENYQNEEKSLVLKEAGCQGMYTPYAQLDVTLFLAALFPWVDEIIKSMDVNAKAFTWIGNLEPLKEKGIKLSPTFASSKQGEVKKMIL